MLGPGPRDAGHGAGADPHGLQLAGGLRAQRHGPRDGLRVVHVGEPQSAGRRSLEKSHISLVMTCAGAMFISVAKCVAGYTPFSSDGF